MTLELADGRGALWQWDTGRRVKVDGAAVKQVHYQNRCFGTTTDVDVAADGTAAIPDEMLQDWHPITVYAYTTDGTGAYTMVQQDFVVRKRGKPADYVYTPTDQMTLQMIQRQIGDLANLTTEAKDTLVAAINEAARTGGGAGSVELRVSDGYIQYSTDGGLTWQSLIAVAELKGAKGDKGDPGPQGDPGKDGITPKIAATKTGKVTSITADGVEIAQIQDGADAAADPSLGITGATPGQIAKITAVDAQGKPTAWEPVEMAEGEPSFRLVFNQECLLDAGVNVYEADIDFSLQDFAEFIALIEYSAATNDVYQDVITFDGVTIESYSGNTAKNATFYCVIYAKRMTLTEYLGILRRGGIPWDWAGGNTASTLAYFGARIKAPTGKMKIFRTNSAEATTITIKLYQR